MMFGNIFVVETSTETGSVAVARDGHIAAALTFVSRDPATGVRTEALARAVAQCLAVASISACDLSAVVCGAGPGGFTSLRSAAALSKGLCSALHIPLYAMSSLELLAWSAAIPNGNYIAALHAGRGEWFGVDVIRDAEATRVTSPEYLVSDDELRARAARTGVRLIGPTLDYDVTPRADAAISKIEQIEAAGPVDLDLWEPAYGRLAEAQVKWEATHGRPLSL